MSLLELHRLTRALSWEAPVFDAVHYKPKPFTREVCKVSCSVRTRGGVLLRTEVSTETLNDLAPEIYRTAALMLLKLSGGEFRDGIYQDEEEEEIEDDDATVLPERFEKKHKT